MRPLQAWHRQRSDRHPLTNVHMRLIRRTCTCIGIIDRGMTGDTIMTDIADVDDARARVTETIKLHPIVLFMKGSPSHPQCGFSAAVVQTLAHYGVPFRGVYVLAAPPVLLS